MIIPAIKKIGVDADDAAAITGTFIDRTPSFEWVAERLVNAAVTTAAPILLTAMPESFG
jgi:hypothetical protein